MSKKSLVEALNKSAPHPSLGLDADLAHAMQVCRDAFKGPGDFKLTAAQSTTIDEWISERGKLRAWGVRPMAGG